MEIFSPSSFVLSFPNTFFLPPSQRCDIPFGGCLGTEYESLQPPLMVFFHPTTLPLVKKMTLQPNLDMLE